MKNFGDPVAKKLRKEDDKLDEAYFDKVARRSALERINSFGWSKRCFEQTKWEWPWSIFSD
jgi:hypothetical protein